jgi:HEPN domain-containing protein
MSSSQQSKEVIFLKISGNHQEFAGKLRQLKIPDTVVLESAKNIAAKWFGLAEQHLNDARKARRGGSHRSAYSRAYYAAYNASKAVRYMVKGIVSLHGDDHGKAPELPGDFVDVAKWSKTITDLYQDRLRADYENWEDADGAFGKSPKEAVDMAAKFLDLAREFLVKNHGVSL